MIGQLNVYSCYSFQNSTILIDQLCKKASEMHYQALALTDENNMFGAMEFNKACHKYHIKPIFGMQASVSVHHEIYPFLLLAQDQVGYHDLMKICSDINLSEEHCIDIEKLALYKEHLFIMSGCKEGIVERLILKELESEALKYMKYFKQLFKNHYHICIQNHHLALQEHLNKRICALALLENIPVCGSNEVRYLQKSDALTLDLLRASAKGEHLSLHHQVISDQLYLKTPYEMTELFDKSIIDQTNHVLKMCNVTIETGIMHLPQYPLKDHIKSQDYLRQLCIVGLKKRFKNQAIPLEYKQRLTKELKVIEKMGFCDYFLIVFDYVRFAKTHDILVGPGRGSAAGSLVAYVLGITNVDPIEHHLFFERFLNEERVSMPDIDIDFQDDRRDEIVQYVTEKYGQEHVGQIVTFSTYGPKVALRDLGKVMNVSLPKLEMLAKYIPTGPKNKKSIKEVYETSYSFQSMINQEPALKEILPSMCLVEYLPRNISMHAAGVVLSKDCLNEVVPLAKGPTHSVITQYSKNYIEDVGLLKMDFLGLKNLTITSYIVKDIQKDNPHFMIQNIDYHDLKTYELLSRGDTLGVFQLEAPGMKNLLRKMKPDSLDDIIAANALYRPGPMASIPQYLARKFKKEKVQYELPCLEPILKSTYGIILYQEQIMQIAQVVAGFTLAKADLLRKAISKKEVSLMSQMKVEFISGSLVKGFNEEQSTRIFDLIEKFADYGLNKAHSVSYAMIAYQLAYLKTHYPLSFYSAILSNEQGSDVHKMNYIQEAREYHIDILPPSINYSFDRFTVENQAIRYSLLAIKNVGYAGYQAIASERKKGLFTSIFDFAARMDGQKVNAKMFESLVDAGAFDEFGYNRATIKENMHKMSEYAKLKQTIGIDEPPILKMIKENKLVRLELEKKALGIYLTTHPIVLIKQKLNIQVISLGNLNQYVNQKVLVVMSLTRVKAIVDKKGNDMCFIEGQDETGSVDGVVFSSTYKQYQDIFERGNVVLIEGKVDYRDKLSLIVQKVKKVV